MYWNTISVANVVLMPKILPTMHHHAHRLVLGSFVLSGALLLSFAIYWIVFRLVLRRTLSSSHRTLRRFRKPAFWLFLIAACTMAIPSFGISSGLEDVIQHTLHIVFI